MQQDTFFYQNFSQDPRLQYPNPNPFPVQNVAPWSGNYNPQANIAQLQGVSTPFNYGNQVTPNLPPITTTHTLSWAHTVPSLMPWVTPSEASIPDPIVRFSAPFPPDPCTSQTATSWELLNNLGASKTNPNMHLKRKSDLDGIEIEAPQKLCITEEKMAARLKELHISNRYTVPDEKTPFGLSSASSYDNISEKTATNLQQLEALLNDTGASNVAAKSIVLAPELKKLVEPEKIFAATFLDKVERPSMAVVVWQPQNKLALNNNSKTEKKAPDSINSSTTKNINFLSQINAICNLNSSFKVDGLNATLAPVSSEAMDT